jgi:hypothetical protein
MRIDLFTHDEVCRAREAISRYSVPSQYIYDNIVTDKVMDRINKATGQTNDRRYMAYRLEFVASQK